MCEFPAVVLSDSDGSEDLAALNTSNAVLDAGAQKRRKKKEKKKKKKSSTKNRCQNRPSDLRVAYTAFHLLTEGSQSKAFFVKSPESFLKGTMKEDGVAIHSLSGGDDLQLQESFDQLKVAVKRGEIDWLHILPPVTWISAQSVLTRCAKLCRIATRRHILWSMHGKFRFELWDSIPVKNLFQIEGAHFIHSLGFGFLTNVPFWNSTSDFAQLSGRFQEFLNRPDCDQKSGEITILTGLCVRKRMKKLLVACGTQRDLSQRCQGGIQLGPKFLEYC